MRASGPPPSLLITTGCGSVGSGLVFLLRPFLRRRLGGLCALLDELVDHGLRRVAAAQLLADHEEGDPDVAQAYRLVDDPPGEAHELAAALGVGLGAQDLVGADQATERLLA